MPFKTESADYQVVDLLPDVGVLRERGVELDHDAVQSVLEQDDPLPDVSLLPGGCRNNNLLASTTCIRCAHHQLLNQGTLTVGRITNWFDLLSQQDLLVRNQLHPSKQQNFSL